MPNLNIQTKPAKTILSKSGIPGCDFVINPYIGCLHGCQYCYASFMCRYTKHLESWGEFADIKINAAELLDKELTKKKPKTVMLSSVTDAYNPLERKYKLTRQILKVLLKHQIPITILTKSDLVTRDIDLLKQFDKCEVGFSFCSHDRKHIRNFENFTATPDKRLRAIKKLKTNGITTYAFIAPILPYITDLPELFKRLKEVNIDFIYCDRLNNRDKAHYKVNHIINNKYPGLAKAYHKIFNTPTDFWTKIAKQAKLLSLEHQIKTRVFFK